MRHSVEGATTAFKKQIEIRVGIVTCFGGAMAAVRFRISLSEVSVVMV